MPHEKAHRATGQAGIPVWSVILYLSGNLLLLSLRHRAALHMRAAKEIGPARHGAGPVSCLTSAVEREPDVNNTAGLGTVAGTGNGSR